jgi:hypothetical protein
MKATAGSGIYRDYAEANYSKPYERCFYTEEETNQEAMEGVG